MLHYLQREYLVRSVVVRRQGLLSLLQTQIAWVFTSLSSVPALTPWIHCSEYALQLAKNTTFVFLCRANIGIAANRARRVPCVARYHLYTVYNIWARTEPWRTPNAIFLCVENSPSTKIYTCLWSQSHKSYALNWFLSSLRLCWLYRLDKIWPWTADGPFGPPLFVTDFAIGHIAWGETSQFPTSQVLLPGPFSWYFEWPSLLPFCMLDPRFLAIIFRAFLYVNNRRSRASTSYFRSKIVVSLVDILHAEASETAKSRALLSASLERRIWILGDVSSAERLWNSLQLQFFNWI
jgi:hypothetical protein